MPEKDRRLFLPNWGGNVVLLTQLYWPTVHPALQERRKKHLTSQQLAILNSLVTFAAEHIPGGLSIDEREVAQIVGGWALQGKIMIKTYQPVFVGKSEKGEKVVIYRDRKHMHDLHICIDDGELQAIPINGSSDITWWSDPFTNTMYIKMFSPVWTGSASGTRRDLIAEEAR